MYEDNILLSDIEFLNVSLARFMLLKIQRIQ